MAIQNILSINGCLYHDTKNLCLDDLKVFIERDIFLAIKKGDLPDLKTIVNVISSRVFVEIVEVGEEVILDDDDTNLFRGSDIERVRPPILSPMGQLIIDNLVAIVIRHNTLKIKINPSGKHEFEGRFCVDVFYSEDLIASQRASLEHSTLLPFDDFLGFPLIVDGIYVDELKQPFQSKNSQSRFDLMLLEGQL